MKTEINRETLETSIKIVVDLNAPGSRNMINCQGLPFFEHMLGAMSLHGGFFLSVEAAGDVDVDPHHLVEDCGLVMGSAFYEIFKKMTVPQRYGHAVIPMDDALVEVVTDFCNRPYLAYNIDYPQPLCGTFPPFLLKEFFAGFVNNARINLHIIGRYGENSHHIAEAAFKAFGIAVAASLRERPAAASASTKGIL